MLKLSNLLFPTILLNLIAWVLSDKAVTLCECVTQKQEEQGLRGHISDNGDVLSSTRALNASLWKRPSSLFTRCLPLHPSLSALASLWILPASSVYGKSFSLSSTLTTYSVTMYKITGLGGIHCLKIRLNFSKGCILLLSSIMPIFKVTLLWLVKLCNAPWRRNNMRKICINWGKIIFD